MAESPAPPAVTGLQEGPALFEGLKSPSVWVREVCVRSLGLDHSAEALEPLLAALRDDGDYRTRYWAAEAVARYDSPKVTAALLRAIADPSPVVQLIASERLGRRAARMSPLISRRALRALEARFREYGDGCQRPDAAYGWRIVGNALVAFGQPGKDFLEGMRAQRRDRWLAWTAYEVVHLPQADDRVLLCEEQEAIATHAKYAPPFPGWRKW